MRRLVTVLLVSAVIPGCVACVERRDEPEAPRLTELSLPGEAARLAVEAIAREVDQQGDVAAEFYVVRVENREERLALHLSHEDDFLSENRNVVGNPSGKSRTCDYDLVAMELIACRFWQ